MDFTYRHRPLESVLYPVSIADERKSWAGMAGGVPTDTGTFARQK